MGNQSRLLGSLLKRMFFKIWIGAQWIDGTIFS